MGANSYRKMQADKGWLSFAGGKWFSWKPLPGLDSSLGESAMWVGSLVYARTKATGRSEDESHREAEKAAYSYHYDVKY
jgi:hypothetical protein